MGEESDRIATIFVREIPISATAGELVAFFESAVGPVFACKIHSAHTNWRSLGHGLVQFDSPDSALKAQTLSDQGRLLFQRASLLVVESYKDIVPRGAGDRRAENVVLRFGIMADERRMEVIGEWKGVRVDITQDRGQKMLMIVLEDGGETYKLDVMFGDVMNSFSCVIGDAMESNAVLLQVRKILPLLSVLAVAMMWLTMQHFD